MIRALLLIFTLLFFLDGYGQSNIFPTDGYVGVGLPNPDVSLHVNVISESKPNGVILPTISGIKLSRTGTNNYAYPEAAEFRIGHGGPSYWGSKLDLFLNGESNQNNVPDKQVMTWMYNGNVGIGTEAPNEKLAVNGKIRAHEIKVEVANWPDYVFAKSYQFITLQETEQYIKDMGHLPGIPSADEVKANGIDLGEMNAKLLQKIEELTLHLIEQNKSQKALVAEVFSLKNLLNKSKVKK